MRFALPVIFTLLCLLNISGSDVTEKYTESTSNYFWTSASRPITNRNQTKVTRDDQLLSLLAARRRQVIQNRLKSGKNIVEVQNSGLNSTKIRSNIVSNRNQNVSNNIQNNFNTDNVNNATIKESNIVNVSSPRSIYKIRKNVFGNGESSKVEENKTSVKSGNVPIIRNILYRRKMSFLNRNLPIDYDPISFDSLSISDINKHSDLILDSEDSLQVEESSHDKLIYYDVKNNATKKSVNNFEDLSDEIKTISMLNKTFHQNNKENNNTKEEINNITLVSSYTEAIIITTEKPNLDEIVVVLNNTENLNRTEKPIKVDIKTNKNNTRFMSPSLYSYFRPLDVPEEEMQPFLRFGEKLPNNKQNLPRNQSIKTTTDSDKQVTYTEEILATVKNEDEIDENMDVSVTKPIYENKITKVNLPNTKVNIARDYFKNRILNKNITEQNGSLKSENKVQILNMQQLRNMTRNRGFRNTTISQHKRNGFRQTINLQPNTTLPTLKPHILLENNHTQNKPIVNNTNNVNVTLYETLPKTLIRTNNETSSNITITTRIKHFENIETAQTEIATTILVPITQNLKNSNQKKYTSTLNETTTFKPERVQEKLSYELNTSTPDLFKTIIPTSVYSTVVVTSVSVEPSKLQTINNTMTNLNNTEIPINTTDITDPEATVIATLSNFTSLAFQSHTKYDKNNTRNPATMYPNITIQMNSFKSHEIKNNISQVIENEPHYSSTDFIINVPDIEISTTTETSTQITNTTTENTQLTTQSIKYINNITTTNPIQNSDTQTSNIKQNTMQFETEKLTTDYPTTEYLDETTIIENKTTTIQTKTETNSELSILTLFGSTDYKKPDPFQNITNLFKTETVISRKNESSLTFDNVHAAYILTSLGFLPMLVIVIYVVRTIMKRRNKMIEDFEAELHNSEKKTIINPVTRLPTLLLDTSNRWEFPRSKLRLQTLLGQGNFGQVWKAEADDLKGHIGLTRLVAVKTIKDGAGTKERDDLLKELAIMQKMGSHPNVVTLLGCCTDKEPYLLIMEYVMYGKLLTFLRDHRTRRDYYNFSDDAATLTARDLTVFAYCVARGMEYLSSKGIIHRDLAARNILVDHNKLCKIADFGMSRDAPTGEITEPRQQRNALPVRWMAIESLLYSLFTHKTDVWSFGILLWEIVTLGSSPYANMSGREVMRLVCDGYRLERPNHCKPELYRVMARTWHADPNQRPTFAELRSELAEMLDNTNAEGSYVDLESFRADSTVYEIDNCTPRGNYFTVKSRFSEFECDI